MAHCKGSMGTSHNQQYAPSHTYVDDDKRRQASEHCIHKDCLDDDPIIRLFVHMSDRLYVGGDDSDDHKRHQHNKEDGEEITKRVPESDCVGM